MRKWTQSIFQHSFGLKPLSIFPYLQVKAYSTYDSRRQLLFSHVNLTKRKENIKICIRHLTADHSGNLLTSFCFWLLSWSLRRALRWLTVVTSRHSFCTIGCRRDKKKIFIIVKWRPFRKQHSSICTRVASDVTIRYFLIDWRKINIKWVFLSLWKS